MTCKLVIVFIMIYLHSTHLLVDATPLVIEPELPINCPIVKCSAGYHSDCQSNGQPGCKQCSNGFYSSHASQTKECLRCSRCGDNEFEVQRCSPTTNVVCQKCRQCYSPFPFVLRSCTRTSDTICGNCSSALGLECEEEKNVEEHSSRREDREKGENEQSRPAYHTTKKFQVMEILAGVNAQPTRPSPTTTSLSFFPVFTTSVCTSIHSIETSIRSTLETRKAANPLPQRKISPTRTVAPFSNPSTKTKEAAVYSETGERKKTIRNKRWHTKNETTNMTEVIRPSSGVSPEPREPSTAAGAGVIFMELSPHFEQDKTMTHNFSLCTNFSATDDACAKRSAPSSFLLFLLTVTALGATGIVFGALYLLFAKAIRRTRCIQQEYRGRSLCQAERGTWRARIPQSRECCVLEFVSNTTARNEDQIDEQATRALNSTETNDPASSSTRNTIISYLSEDAKSVCGVFPDFHCMCLRSELLFVTSAHGSFDNSGGTLTHPDSDVCINIEPGTFLDGNQQSIFFHVIYNDTYVIRDIPETNERTLISPVIKCGPDDINPQKAMEIVVPHCLYEDEVKKGSIAVYRSEQFTNEGPQNWKEIPFSSERSSQSKAWFSIKKDSIVIKTTVFSIWSIFVCGVGGSKRKRVTAFFSKPNPESNLISLRCYIYSDNEDSKRKVKRFEEEHFLGSKSSIERPLKLYSDNQDIAVWLDNEALAERGWVLDGTPASQNYTYEMAHKNGFRCKSACQFAVKPIAECSTRVEDFSCSLYFQQNGHTKDFIYVNPGIPLLPPQMMARDCMGMLSQKLFEPILSCLLVDATPLGIEPELPIKCPIVKCSAGYHSDCQSNGQPRCKQCSNGFYSSRASQMKECLRCSHCGDNEFEVQPCSPTTNVICQKCRECYPPFPFVLRSCTRTSDTVCGNCSSALGLECDEEKNPEEHSSRRENREKGNNEQSIPAHHTKRKFQVIEIPAGVRVQPTRPSPITISLPLSFVPTMSVSTSIHSIDNSTRSIRETRIAADPLPQTKKSPTRTFAPFSSPSTKKKETAVYSETGEKKNTIRNKRWHSKFETRNMTEALKQSSDVSPEPWEHSTEAGVIFSPHFEQDKTTTYKFSLRTTANTAHYALPEPSGSSPVRISIFTIQGTVFVLVVFVLLAIMIKRKRCTQRGSRGLFFCRAERGTQKPRCPESRESCIDRQAPRALKSAETDDSALSSTQNTIISYLSEDIKSVREVFPEDQSMHMWSELLFVTSACDNFDSTGGKLTHPNSDICINIEPGTFPHGKQQPIFFHVVYNDTYVIRDIPETNERTLISPVIKCGPDDINPQKAMEIVVPHCLYVDEVKKGSIAVYRCEQFTNEEQIEDSFKADKLN
ncbi:PREDICTED: uncharacterized protein LOC107355591 [Acropora digitifera]|uniref:uncharacterized protein LOC107355591 n=1 Tax=Acropora digitifera TaxID=70779 RepID=UPI00077B0C59|nr:PREDICTED: uncharacterized protein LOC107355591 [Acropora digitifera]